MFQKLKSMKKIAFILTVCVVTITTSVSAQGFRLGLTGSPSLSWFKSETEDYKSEGVRMGISYGLLAEFLMADQYSFATGINIVYFGGKLSYPQTNMDMFTHIERTYKLQNIEVPLTLKMKTREIGYNVYFARFGFGGSVNLRAKANDEYFNKGNTSSLNQNDVDIKSDIPLFRASMIVGIGLEHSLGGSTSLVGGLTFNNGFTNILKGKDYANIRNQQARANYFEVSLGILF
jgi:hypothetical protein